MAFWGDYHTHTVYSHGKGTPEENVLRAISLGLKEIAITDHGFRHMTYQVRRMDWSIIRGQVDALKIKYPEINIYLGLETNFTSAKGNIDILPSDMRYLDILVCGFHNLALPNSFLDLFKFYIPNYVADFTGKPSRKLILSNTDAYIKAIEKNDIDIISHINYGLTVDVKEVATACKYYGTYVELNGKRISMTDKEIETVAEVGAEFVCDSDAHSVERVGDFSVPIAVIERIGLDYSQIANWERLPNLRSRRGKQGEFLGNTND